MAEEKKNLLTEIKKLVFSEVEEEFLDVKTAEGIVLRVSEVKEGEVVTIISEDGENVSGASEYVLEDGSKIIVDENGVITAIETEVEEATEAPAEEEMSDNDKAVAARLGEITEALAGVLSKFSEQDDIIKLQEEAIAKFAAAPSTEEKDAGRTVLVKHGKESALKALANYRREIKK